MQWSWRDRVGKLLDGVCDPMPNRYASVITDRRKLLGTALAIRSSFATVAIRISNPTAIPKIFKPHSARSLS